MHELRWAVYNEHERARENKQQQEIRQKQYETNCEACAW